MLTASTGEGDGVGTEPADGALVRLEELYRVEYSSAVGLAVLLTGNPAVAEELAQEAFVRIASRLAEAEQPGAYLRQTLVNLCRDAGRRTATVRRHPAAAPGITPAPALPADQSAEWQALQQLPLPQRHALVLRYWADLPTAEIARLLGIPHPTVRSHIRRGLASLKEVLSDER